MAPRPPSTSPERLITSMVPRFATCSWPGCQRPTARKDMGPACHMYVCAIHAAPACHAACPHNAPSPTEHPFESVYTELNDILERLDTGALIETASRLRGGQPCTFVPGMVIPESLWSGGQSALEDCHYLCTLCFEDDVDWVVCIFRDAPYQDRPLVDREYLVASEYATLRYLDTLIAGKDERRLTPRAHAFGLASDPGNKVGVSYILTDALPGKPFNHATASRAQAEHVHTQYAEFLARLATRPLRLAGSLLPCNFGRGTTVGPGQVVSADTADTAKGTPGGPLAICALASDQRFSLGVDNGPYPTALGYFAGVAGSCMDLVADGQLHHQFPKESYLFYRLLRDRAAPLLAEGMGELFFLRHAFGVGRYILVDEDYNITGITGWTFARLAPASEAFGPPLRASGIRCVESVYRLPSRKLLLVAAFAAKLEQAHREGRVSDEVAALVTPLLDKYDSTRRELAHWFHLGIGHGLRERHQFVRLLQEILWDIQRVEGGPNTPFVVDAGTWLAREWDAMAGEPDHEKIERLLDDLAARDEH